MSGKERKSRISPKKAYINVIPVFFQMYPAAPTVRPAKLLSARKTEKVMMR
jgi:hypothetical protein